MAVKTDREPPAATVDEYLAAVPEGLRAVLEDLRAAIRAAAPEAVETISYRIPTYTYRGPLVHFAAFKDHVSFIVVDPSVLETFGSELAGFGTSGTTIHLRAGHPLPAPLVARIVRLRMEQNESRGPRRRTSTAVATDEEKTAP